MEWYQEAVHALEFAVADNERYVAEDEDPPTEDAIAAVANFLNEASETLFRIAIPAISISCNGTIYLRWTVPTGRVDVSFSDTSVQAFVSNGAENKAIEKGDVSRSVLSLVA